MKRRMKTAIMATLLLLIPVSGCGANKEERQQAPEFELKNLNGQVISLSSYEGKPILINFWATWCIPCLKEIPDLVRLQKTLSSDGNAASVIGIAVASGAPSDIGKFAIDHHMNYPILLDPDQKIFQRYKGIGLPTSFLIDPRGKVVRKYTGPKTYIGFLDDIKTFLKTKS